MICWRLHWQWWVGPLQEWHYGFAWGIKSNQPLRSRHCATKYKLGRTWCWVEKSGTLARPDWINWWRHMPPFSLSSQLIRPNFCFNFFFQFGQNISIWYLIFRFAAISSLIIVRNWLILTGNCTFRIFYSSMFFPIGWLLFVINQKCL